MLILGIDPGYAIVGWGMIEYKNSKFKVISYGAITTPATLAFEKRLIMIDSQLEEIITKFKPEFLSIEKLFFTTNAKTVIDVAQARGVIINACAKKDIQIHEYTPLQVKLSVVGYGKAIKKQVMEMTKQLLNLKEIPKPDDTADALALAICHAHSFNSMMRTVQNISCLENQQIAQNNKVVQNYRIRKGI